MSSNDASRHQSICLHIWVLQCYCMAAAILLGTCLCHRSQGPCDIMADYSGQIHLDPKKWTDTNCFKIIFVYLLRSQVDGCFKIINCIDSAFKAIMLDLPLKAVHFMESNCRLKCCHAINTTKYEFY